MKFLIFTLIIACLLQFSQQIQISQNTEKINPGIEIEVTKSSINHLTKKLIPTIDKQITGIQIPDFKKEISGAKLEISNAKISNFTIDSQQTQFAFQNNELQFTIDIQDLKVDFHYKGKYSIFSLKDDGNIEMKQMIITLLVKVVNVEGRLQLQVDKVTTEKPHDLEIDLGSGTAKKLVAKQLKSAFDEYFDQIQQAIEDIIKEELEKLDDEIPKTIDIQKIRSTFDMSLVQDPEIVNNTLFLRFNGAFYPIGHKPIILNPKTVFEPIKTSNATKIFVSQEVINSLLKSIISTTKQNEIHFDFPGELQTTTNFNSMTFQTLFPKMKPYMSMEDWRAVGLSLKDNNVFFQANGKDQSLIFDVQTNIDITLEKLPSDNELPSIKTLQKLYEQFIDNNVYNLTKNTTKTGQNQQKVKENLEIYSKNIESSIKLDLGLLTNNKNFNLQFKNFDFTQFKPSKQDILDGKFNFNQIKTAGPIFRDLLLGIVNGNVFYNTPIDIEKLLEISVQTFEILIKEGYLVLLIDL